MLFPNEYNSRYHFEVCHALTCKMLTNGEHKTFPHLVFFIIK